MSVPPIITIAEYAWGALGSYWIASARQSGATKTPEPHIFRALRFVILGTTFGLLFSPWLRIGPLGWRYMPKSEGVEALGLAMTIAGIGLTAWARLRLGRNWSDKVVIKKDHQLIRTGPYAYFRHPIYSGVLFAVAGTALVIGEWRGVASFCLLLVTYSIKAKKEERVLAAAFGAQFEDHVRRTGFLLPRLNARARGD